MSERLQVKGFCEKVEQKPGSDWREYHINVGKQYPVKLSSRLPEIIALADAAGQQEAIWTFDEKESETPNPHRPGTFFKNRWLVNVEIGGQMTMPSAPVGGGSSGAGMPQSGESPEVRRSIERQVIVKAAIKVLPPDQITTMAGWWALVRQLDQFMREEPGSPPAAPPADDPNQAPVPADDDIPF